MFCFLWEIGLTECCCADRAVCRVAMAGRRISGSRVSSIVQYGIVWVISLCTRTTQVQRSRQSPHYGIHATPQVSPATSYRWHFIPDWVAIRHKPQQLEACLPSGKHSQTANNGRNKGAMEILPYEIWTLNQTQNIVLTTMAIYIQTFSWSG